MKTKEMKVITKAIEYSLFMGELFDLKERIIAKRILKRCKEWGK